MAQKSKATAKKKAPRAAIAKKKPSRSGSWAAQKPPTKPRIDKLPKGYAGAVVCTECLPCPFCGMTPSIQPWHGGGPQKKMISCMDEGAVRCHVSPEVTGETRKSAIARWNGRVAPQEETEHSALGVIKSYMDVAEEIDSVERRSVRIETSQTDDGDVHILMWAMLSHRTGRGPVRCGGLGESLSMALKDLRERVAVEDEKAAKRAERKERR